MPHKEQYELNFKLNLLTKHVNFCECCRLDNSVYLNLKQQNYASQNS